MLTIILVVALLDLDHLLY